MQKRKDTFKEYRERHVGSRVDIVKAALKSFENAHYNNITRLAKDVASFVTQFEKAENDYLPENARQENIKSVSHVTILRNVEYRSLLDGFLTRHLKQGASPQLTVDTEMLFVELQALRSKNTLLQNALLNEGLSGDQVSVDSVDQTQFYEWMESLLVIMENMDRFSPGCFRNYTEEPGRWGFGLNAARGLVATSDQMLMIQNIKRALGEWKSRGGR